jgi:hypothetical protein
LVDAARQARLYEAKARALVRDNFGAPEPSALNVPGGAGFRDGDRLWVYAPDEPGRSLGRSLALAAREGTREIHVIVESGDGDLARRASLLRPPVSVWRVHDRSLVPVPPAPLPVEMEPPAGAERLVGLLRAAGADVVVEHGVIYGEIRGLEVARVRVADDGEVVLDVGVGRFDQEATAILHGHLPTEDALARAVDEVERHRRPAAAPHPVNRLARDRWLRAQVLDDPSLVGLRAIEPIAPATPRRNTRDALPAGAIGVDDDGARVLVVTSVGVDLDLVPVAADLAAREHADRIVLVTPPRDQVPVLRSFADRLPLPTTLVAVEGDWPR